MRNIYPENKTIYCPETLNLTVSKKIAENGIEEVINSLYKILEDQRLFIYLNSPIKEEKYFLQVMGKEQTLTIAYFYNEGNPHYYITQVREKNKTDDIQWIKRGILIYFKNIKIRVKEKVYENPKQKNMILGKVKSVSLANLGKAIKQCNQEKEVMVKEKVNELLDYATLFNQREKLKGEQENNELSLNYTKIETQMEQENSYVFHVGNGENYQEGDYVNMTDSEGNEIEQAGQIISLKQTDHYHSQLTIQFIKQMDYRKIPQEGRIQKVYNDVQFKVREKVIKNIKDGTIPANYLYQVLEDFSYQPFKTMNFTSLEEKMAKEKYPLNPSQIKAVEKGIASQDLSLVLGPPGTGKTTVIAWWVKYFLSQNKRVLISSQNNSAVDNVIERIGKEYKNIIRIGDDKKVAENVKEFLYSNKMAEFKNTLKEKAETQLQHNEKKEKMLQEEIEKGEKLVQQIHEKKQLEEKIRTPKKELTQKTQENEKLLTSYRKNKEIVNELIKKNTQEQNGQNIVITIWNTIKKNYRKNRINKKEIQLKEEQLLMENNQKIIYAIQENQEFKQTNEKIKKINQTLSKYSQKQLAQVDQTLTIMNKELEKTTKIKEALHRWNEHIKERNDCLTAILLDSTQVVGATCIGIQSRKLFADTTFDIAIVDEAGQIQIHNLLVPISRAKKAILLGDHKQIPPMADTDILKWCKENDINTNLYENSFFQYLYEQSEKKEKSREHIQLLDTQFRVPAEVADVISEWFYDNQYHSFEKKRNMPPISPILEEPFCLIDTHQSSARKEKLVNDQNGNRVPINVYEAKIIAELVHYLLGKQIVKESEIGVIVPYREQLAKIRTEIKSTCGKQVQLVEEMVKTLDSFQGQERDVIIYGITRCNDKDKTKRRIGFLKELRRFNVALTRGKKQVIVVGDFEFLQECAYEGEKEDNVSTEKDFGEFVSLMVKRVKEGKGAMLEAEKLRKKLEQS